MLNVSLPVNEHVVWSYLNVTMYICDNQKKQPACNMLNVSSPVNEHVVWSHLSYKLRFSSLLQYGTILSQA